MGRMIRPQNLNDVFQQGANYMRQKPVELSHRHKVCLYYIIRVIIIDFLCVCGSYYFDHDESLVIGGDSCWLLFVGFIVGCCCWFF